MLNSKYVIDFIYFILFLGIKYICEERKIEVDREWEERKNNDKWLLKEKLMDFLKVLLVFVSKKNKFIILIWLYWKKFFYIVFEWMI